MDSIGKRIKNLRKSGRLTQNRLAEKAGFDYRHYQDIEAGKVNVGVGSLQKIAKGLSVPLCYLLNFSKNEFLEKADIQCPIELLSKLNIAIAIADINGIVHYRNAAHERFFQSNAESSDAPSCLWHFEETPEDFEYLKKIFKSLTEKNTEPITYIKKQKCLDNKTRRFLFGIDYLYNSQKNLVGICVYNFLIAGQNEERPTSSNRI